MIPMIAMAIIGSLVVAGFLIAGIGSAYRFFQKARSTGETQTNKETK